MHHNTQFGFAFFLFGVIFIFFYENFLDFVMIPRRQRNLIFTPGFFAFA